MCASLLLVCANDEFSLSKSAMQWSSKRVKLGVGTIIHSVPIHPIYPLMDVSQFQK
jgi:hypothetical protein